MSREIGVVQQAFALSILEAREKAGKLTEEQSELLKTLRALEKQRRGLLGSSAGVTLESEQYGGGISGIIASDNPLRKLEEKRAEKQARLGGSGGSHN